MSQKYCLVYSTCPESGTYAQDISNNLITKKLAACVNVISNIDSIYRWKDQVEISQEKLLIIKTTLPLFDKIKNEILQTHPYECPEIIMVPIIDGLSNYMSWLNSCL